jgi:hypothetical protein
VTLTFEFETNIGANEGIYESKDIIKSERAKGVINVIEQKRKILESKGVI